MRSTGRSVLAALVTVLTSVVLLVAILAHYANNLTNTASFSSRAVTLVQNGAVESLVVNTITNRVMSDVGDQQRLQPVIRFAVSQALSNAQVAAEIRSAASTLQGQLVSGHATGLTLTLPDIGSAAAAAVQSRSPQLADLVRRLGTITVLHVPIPSSAVSAIHALAQVGNASALLIALSVALALLALILAVRRRRTFMGLGLGAVVSGLVAAAVYVGGRTLVVNEFSSSAGQTAARSAWGIYLGGLETTGLIVAAVGAAVAVVAAISGRERRRQGPPDFGLRYER